MFKSRLNPIYNVDTNNPFAADPSSTTISPASWTFSAAWNWLITSMWDLFSIPLDILRELQNTASIQVSASSISQSPLYQPQFVIGAYVVPNSVSAADYQKSQNFTRSYSNRSAPKQFRVSVGKSEVKAIVKSSWTEPYFAGYSFEDMAYIAGAIAALVMLFSLASIFALAWLIISRIFKLVLYILKPTVLIVFMGIVAGIMGFIRGTILAPIAFALSFIATDFSNGFSDQKHIEAFQHIFQNSQMLNWKMQFTLAFKQLSVWLLAVSVIFALLWIDNAILSQWQESALIKAWIGDITNQFWMKASAYFVVGLTTLLYGLLITKSYGFIKDYMQQQTLNDPLLNKIGEMLKDQTKLADKITNKIT